MDRFQIISLDAEGEIVEDRMTKETWSISELKLYFDKMASDLYNKKVANIVVTRIL